MKEQGLNVWGLLFDDLIKNKEDGVRAIFKVSNLSEDLVADAMEAFTRDSQKNSIISMDKFSKVKPLEYTPEDVEKSSKLLVDFGYPPLDKGGHLEGTIDFKEVLGTQL
jgi:hypothetical protein